MENLTYFAHLLTYFAHFVFLYAFYPFSKFFGILTISPPFFQICYLTLKKLYLPIRIKETQI